MRKSVFKAIKKTDEWLHRKKGTDLLILPEEARAEGLRFLKMYGSSQILEDGSLNGVGDYDEESGRYIIGLHVRANENMLGGLEFGEIHYARGISYSSAKFFADAYFCIPHADYNGTVVIDNKHVKFKENTAYTIAFHTLYNYSARPRDVRLSFAYSDGTSDVCSVNSAYTNLKACVSSDPSKTLVALTSYTITHSGVRIYYDGFGIYEGVYTDYESFHVAYDGERVSIALDEPLRGIDGISDELDFISCTVTRKIFTEAISTDCSIGYSDTDAVFEIPLTHEARLVGKLVSPFPALSAGEDSGIEISEDGKLLRFKASESITSSSDIITYLSENPFKIAYVLKSPITESIGTADIPLREGQSIIDVFSEVAPSKFIAEYA